MSANGVASAVGLLVLICGADQSAWAQLRDDMPRDAIPYAAGTILIAPRGAELGARIQAELHAIGISSTVATLNEGRLAAAEEALRAGTTTVVMLCRRDDVAVEILWRPSLAAVGSTDLSRTHVERSGLGDTALAVAELIRARLLPPAVLPPVPTTESPLPEGQGTDPEIAEPGHPAQAGIAGRTGDGVTTATGPAAAALGRPQPGRTQTGRTDRPTARSRRQIPRDAVTEGDRPSEVSDGSHAEGASRQAPSSSEEAAAADDGGGASMFGLAFDAGADVSLGEGLLATAPGAYLGISVEVANIVYGRLSGNYGLAASSATVGGHLMEGDQDALAIDAGALIDLRPIVLRVGGGIGQLFTRVDAYAIGPTGGGADVPADGADPAGGSDPGVATLAAGSESSQSPWPFATVAARLLLGAGFALHGTTSVGVRLSRTQVKLDVAPDPGAEPALAYGRFFARAGLGLDYQWGGT